MSAGGSVAVSSGHMRFVTGDDNHNTNNSHGNHDSTNHGDGSHNTGFSGAGVI